MGEERGTGLWIGVIGFAVAALIFLVLWFMRGEDVDRLTADLGTSQASVQRLENDLGDVRRQVDSSNRRVSELESQVREETRRLTEASNQLERRLRSELDFSAQQLASANAELESLRENEKAVTVETARIRDELDRARKDLADTRSAGVKEVERFNQRLADANNTIKDLEARLETGNASIQSLEQALKSTRIESSAGAGNDAASELADIKSELTKTALALSDARNANAMLEEMRSRLASSIESDKTAAISREQELMRTIEELTARIDSQPRQDSFMISAAIPDNRDREIVALKQEVTGYQRKITELEVAGEHAAAVAASATASAGEWKNRTETLEKELADWKNQASADAAALAENFQGRLDAAEREFESFRNRSSAVAKAADAAWRDRLIEAERDLEALRVESASKTEKLEADLKSRLAAAERELAEFKSRADAETANLEAKIASRDNELAAAEKRLVDELAAGEKRLVDELASLKREYELNIRNLENDFRHRLDGVRKEASEQIAIAEKRSAEQSAASEKRAKELLADSERRSAAKISEITSTAAARQDAMRKELEARDARIGKLEEGEKESAQRIILLKNAFTRQGEILKETAARYEKEKEELKSNISGLEKSLAEVSPGGPKFAPFPIGRSVGRIVDRLSDGQILLIEGGVNQRMRPGMKFDAFRPVGEGNRYAGMIKIVRVLEDHSMAISSFTEVNAMVCPITGRAVLEPDAKYSPYAVDNDGMPVKLVPADKIGIPLEAPAIGDFIDNPFYEPTRQMRFAIDPVLAGDPCIAATVEALGGTVRVGDLAKDVDFIVVENADSSPDAIVSGPRRISIGHLARYLDPSPAK